MPQDYTTTIIIIIIIVSMFDFDYIMKLAYVANNLILL